MLCVSLYLVDIMIQAKYYYSASLCHSLVRLTLYSAYCINVSCRYSDIKNNQGCHYEEHCDVIIS